MKQYNIVSVATKDYIPLVCFNLFFLSIFKKPESQINYYIFLDIKDFQIKNTARSFFQIVPANKNIKLIIVPITQEMKDCITVYERDINGKKFEPSYTTFIRCLLPTWLPKVDKLLYLDIDALFINYGLEDLYDTDISDVYAACVIDPIIQHFNTLTEKDNVKTDKYFNAGVSLMNLKKIREDGLDKKLKKAVKKWPFKKILPFYFDQTLINYYFKNKIKELPIIYNNILLSCDVKEAEKMKQVYPELNDMKKFINDTIIVHFVGNKPWLKYEDIHYKMFPFLKYKIQIWKSLVKLYNEKIHGKKDDVS